MNLQFITFSLLLASFCSFSVGLPVRRKERVTNVESLREAVNDAFDALTEVHEAIAKLEDSSNDASDSKEVHEAIAKLEESSNDASHSKDNGDEETEKDTAEKFVEEIDQLEDMMTKKKNTNEFVVESREKEEKKDENDSKAVHLPMNLVETNALVSTASDEFNDDDIKQSVDFLVNVLKEGLQQEKRDSKLKDYLLSIFEKETRAVKGNGAAESLVNAKEKKVKIEKQTDEKIAATTRELSADLSTKELRDEKKENKKRGEVMKSAQSDIKSESIKKETTNRVETNSKENTKLSDNTSDEKEKKHVKEVKKDSFRKYDSEVQDLVDMILKRKEELKREKLKLAVADMFQIMEGKEEDAYKQRNNDEASKEIKKYERMLMDNKVRRK